MKNKKLSDIFHISSGGTPPRKNAKNYGGDIPWIKIGDIKNAQKGIIYSTEENITSTGLKSIRNKLFPKNTLLLAMYGSVGKVAFCGTEMALNQAILGLVPKKEGEVYPKYIYYWLQLNLNSLKNMARGGILKNLSATIVKKITVDLPSFHDQIRIASLLSRIEALITTRKENLILLDDFLKSTFLEMFGDPVGNDKNWKLIPLEDIGSVDRGVSKHRPRNAPELLGGKYPLIQTGDVTQAGTYITEYKQTYSEIGFKQSKLWPKETLCITIAANIARTGILKFESCFPDSVVGFIADKKETTPIYIHFLFGFFQRILEKNAPQAAQKNINLKILRTLKVPVPPLEKQQNFEKVVLKAESIKSLYQQNLTDLENLYGAVSQKAFKGELDLSSLPIPDKEIQINEISTDYKEIIYLNNKENEMINKEPFSKAVLEKYLGDNKGRKLSSVSILNALKEEYSIPNINDYVSYLTELLESKKSDIEQVFSIMTKDENETNPNKKIGIYIK